MRGFPTFVLVLTAAMLFAGCTSGYQQVSDHSISRVSSQAESKTPKQDVVGNMAAQKLTASDMFARLRTAGLTANATGQLPKPLFGAISVEGISIEGTEGAVYVFEDKVAATNGLSIASNPQANTVSWAAEPRFFQLENLVLVLATTDGTLAGKIAAGLK